MSTTEAGLKSILDSDINNKENINSNPLELYREAIKNKDVLKAFEHLENIDSYLIDGNDIKTFLVLCVFQNKSNYFIQVFNKYSLFLGENLKQNFLQFALEQSRAPIICHLQLYFSEQYRAQKKSEPVLFYQEHVESKQEAALEKKSSHSDKTTSKVKPTKPE